MYRNTCNSSLFQANDPELRLFFKNYVIGGGGIPKADTLRKFYIPKLVNSEEERLKEIVRDRPLAIIVDETTDVRQRYVFNVLVLPLDDEFNPDAKSLSQPCVLKTVELSKVNNRTISDAITDVLQEYGILFRNVRALVSDGASYMRKAWKDILQFAFREAVFVVCSAHILALIGDVWRSAFPEVDRLVGLMKCVLSKAPARRGRFLRYLESHGVESPALPVAPVITRWNSWFSAVESHEHKLEYYLGFVKQELEEEASSTKLRELEILLSQSESDLQAQVSEIVKTCQRLMSTLDRLQSRERLSHIVYNVMTDLQAWLKGLALASDASRDAAETASTKLEKYLTTQGQPALTFLAAVRLLDPSQSYLAKSPANRYDTIKEVLHLPDACDNEWPVYLAIIDDESEPTGGLLPVVFWKHFASRLPHLSASARTLLSLPVNSADVERSFSGLNQMLAPQRQSMTFATMAHLLKLGFNK